VTPVGDVESIVKAGLAIGAPLATVVGFGGRNRRLRHDIRENLALVDEVEKHAPLREVSLSSAWLQGRVALDIAKLTGQDFGARKKPIQWSSVLFAFLLSAGFAAWTYWIVRDGFIWYAVFPGIAATLFGIAVLGMFTNRDLPPEENVLPPGAVRAPTDSATERIATAVTLAAVGGLDERFDAGGQVDVVLTYAKMLQLGAYEAGIALAEENWIRCRVYAWIWNNRSVFGDDVGVLQDLADDMLDNRGENEVWAELIASESRQFADTWGPIDFDQYGVAGNRRRMSPDLDLVLLVPVGSSGGYFVMSATAIPNAMPFLVRRHGDTWRIANHVGHAPAVAEWPPISWITDDPAVQALPD